MDYKSNRQIVLLFLIFIGFICIYYISQLNLNNSTVDIKLYKYYNNPYSSKINHYKYFLYSNTKTTNNTVIENIVTSKLPESPKSPESPVYRNQYSCNGPLRFKNTPGPAVALASYPGLEIILKNILGHNFLQIPLLKTHLKIPLLI